MSGLRGFRDRIVSAGLGVPLARIVGEFQESLARVEGRLLESERGIASMQLHLEAQTELLRRERDGLASLVEGLAAIRLAPEYDLLFGVTEPLISVRIASYGKTEELMDVAIASVLAQTYQNFEIVVVNDGPDEDTRHALALLDDPRVHYEEFPERQVYPSDARARWMVAGSPGMNRGADLSRGVWIAPLDNDDAFTADHLEKLLALALRERAELSYGALTQVNRVNGEERRIWSSPPAISQFSFQGAMYLRLLHNVFRYDESSWLIGEPGDWNLIRRMVAAGVRMAATEDIVAIMNHVPYTHKGEG